MRKTLPILIVFALLILMPNASALISKGYTHSYDYYTVSYDGEGDAIVRAKLNINNNGENNIEELALEFPLGEVIVFQLSKRSRSKPARSS